MQNKPNETRTIALLAAGILIAFGLVVWQLWRANQPGSKTDAPTQQAESPGATGGSNRPVQMASNTDSGQPQSAPGQMRLLDGPLDTDPPPGQVPEITGGRADAFRQIKPPSIKVASKNGPGVYLEPIPPVKRGDARLLPGPIKPLENAKPPTPPALSEPSLEITLDGVVVGADGFAMLTVRDPGTAKDAVGAEQTVFRHVGERIAGYRLARLTSSGVQLEGVKNLWPVGQTQHFGPPVTTTSAPHPESVKNP